MADRCHRFGRVRPRDAHRPSVGHDVRLCAIPQIELVAHGTAWGRDAAVLLDMHAHEGVGVDVRDRTRRARFGERPSALLHRLCMLEIVRVA